MKFVKNTLATAKTMPRGVWIAALILPGGLTALGIWLAVKGAYSTVKGKFK